MRQPPAQACRAQWFLWGRKNVGTTAGRGGGELETWAHGFSEGECAGEQAGDRVVSGMPTFRRQEGKGSH